FYQSPQHVECLQKLELSIRLRRGLSIVVGDVGAGKTTICRQMIRGFAEDSDVDAYLILDPSFGRSIDFLRSVAEILGIENVGPDLTEWHLKERIKNRLFDKGVGKGKTLVLIIDEGQKIPEFCLEILREFLNYETNEHKLLQIVIFAQKEFYPLLEAHRGFADRVNFLYELRPLSFSDTRGMIRFRLDNAREKEAEKDIRFTLPALWVIHRATGGYPRKIVGLCHRIILALIIQNRLRADFFLARSCARGRELPGKSWKMPAVAVLGCLLITVVGMDFGYNLFFTQEPAQPIRGVVMQPGEAVAIPVKSQREQPSPPISVKVPQQEVIPVEEKQIGHTEPYPESLGWLIVKKDETICKVIRGLYGADCTGDRVASVRKANPHIGNPDIIEPGTMLKLPATPADESSLRGYLVALERRDNLEDAHTVYRSYRGKTDPIQIFPHWNAREGLQFDIILKKGFADEDTARSAIDRLPSSIASKAHVLHSWDGDTVFFSTVAPG
ncbi:MAG: AAA family ATPase, partial [Deltaproteobacteria bacterium]|nr:AAA family ATPase [Deltaproteobacteria bacterium]